MLHIPQRLLLYHGCQTRGFSSLVRIRGEETLNRLFQRYENFVGLTVVKNAQDKVIKAESEFICVQQERQNKQTQLLAVQQRLKAVSYELEKLQRTDDRYLTLITEEHRIIKEEDSLHKELEQLEDFERQQFSLMSIALRDSHEKERAQSERTKYWSIGGSCLGAAIGIIGSTVNNHIKMNKLRRMFEVSSEQSSTAISQRLDTINDSLTKVTESVESRALNSNLNNNEEQILDVNINEVDQLEKLEERLREMEEIISRHLVTGTAIITAVVLGSFLLEFFTR